MDGTPSIVHKTRPLKKIWYLPHINQSPTSTSVVAETIRGSLRITSEGQKENITVTHDFATEKLAIQIKAEEKLITFDKFFSLGSFHLEMAFSFLGKTIEQSVGSHVLDECQKGQLIRKAINDLKECVSF